jgi:hypothetical protein
MKKEMFDNPVNSVEKAGRICRGEQQPSRMMKMIDYKGDIARIQFAREDQIFVCKVVKDTVKPNLSENWHLGALKAL